jgi:hypothetical protein
VRAAQNLFDELTALLLRERLQGEPRVTLASLAPGGAAFEQRGAREAQQHDGVVRAVEREVVYEVERAVIGPVYVVEIEERGQLARDVGEEARGVAEGAVAHLSRVITYP